MSDLFSFLSWWLVVTLCGLLAWPLQFRLLRFLPDRGYSLTKTAGLLAVGYIGWLLGNFGFVQVDSGGVIAAMLVVAAISLVAFKGQAEEMRQHFRSARYSVLAVEIVFLVAFAAWAYVRALNPNITYTEKPMEFGFLNSVLRTGVQPPGDPWLAGYAISYYHFGYVIIGMLTAISGVLPSVAFNLGIALLFGLTATGAFGVAFNLVAATRRAEASGKDEAANPLTPLVLAAFPALLGPLFILMGNFYGAFQVAYKSDWFAASPDQTAMYTECPVENRFCITCAVTQCADFNPASNLWSWLDIKGTNNPPEPVAQSTDPAKSSTPSWMPDQYIWYWQSSRVVHDRDLSGAEVEVIDEFPFFSFLLGDMHPHVLGLPFVFLAILFAFNLFLTVQADSERKTEPFDRARWRETLPRIWPLTWPDLLWGAVILGGLSFLNTWDFPIYLFVVTAAYAVARAMRDGWQADVLRDSAILGLSLAVAGVLLYLPFYIGFRSQLGGVLPNLVFGTRVPQFIIMFGPSLCVVAVLLGWLAIKRKRDMNWINGLWLGAGTLLALIALSAFLAVAAVTLLGDRPDVQNAVTAIIGSASIRDALGLILQRRLEWERVITPLLVTTILTIAAAFAFGSKRRTDIPDSEQRRESVNRSLTVLPFVAVLIITGALLTLGPEFVYLRDLFSTRMNTIFKFYYQAWVVWSLSAAFGLWLLFRVAGPVGRVLAGSLAAVGIALGLVYPVLSTSTVTQIGFWGSNVRDADNNVVATLDGMAHLEKDHPGDYEAIKFLNATVQGRPVIAEAVGGSYTDYARVSAHTGLPTVIGWPFHEYQWRGNTEVFGGREEDVRTLYTTNDWPATLEIIQKYNIQYVYVGPMESGQYGTIALEKFDRYLSKIYESNGVIIYEYEGES